MKKTPIRCSLIICIPLIILLVILLIPLVITCENGRVVGCYENNSVCSFKGIPYAQPPIGELRWKKPVPIKPGKGVVMATEFGHVALQANDPTGGEAAASSKDKSEDCLTLNIWVSNQVLRDVEKGENPKAPVMVYFHGGSYCMGGTVDPLYDGRYLVAAHPDIIVVTVNYRLNYLGFIDLHNIPGWTNEYADSEWLGILDQQEALRWIQRNISNFGGDASNVTIFGESAGGGSVSSHLTARGSEGLFRRAIIMSGAPDLTMTQDAADTLKQAESLREAMNKLIQPGQEIVTIKDMVAFTDTSILMGAYGYPTGIKGMFGIEYLYGNAHFPIRRANSIIPEDPFDALEKGASKDVDVMIGTTWDEFNYFVHLFHNVQDGKMTIDTTGTRPFTHVNNWLKEYTAAARIHYGDGGEAVDRFMEIAKSDYDYGEGQYPGFWKRVELINELYFRQGSILAAELHSLAQGKGKTYMYFFGKGYDEKAIKEQPWIGAMHACELTYAFNQPDFPKGGPYDERLTELFSTAFVNFARTGNPSGPLDWPTYDTIDRYTMVIERDGRIHSQKDPRSEYRKILSPGFRTYFKNRKPF